MAGKKQGYKITVAGPGHNFEQSIDAEIASKILSLVMTGAITTGGVGTGSSIGGAAGSNAVGAGGVVEGQTAKQFVTSKKPTTQ
jgi:hypothetical protein